MDDFLAEAMFDAIFKAFDPLWRTEAGSRAVIQDAADRVGLDSPKYLRLIVHPEVYRAAGLWGYDRATVLSASGRRLYVDECPGMKEPVLIVHDCGQRAALESVAD